MVSWTYRKGGLLLEIPYLAFSVSLLIIML